MKKYTLIVLMVISMIMSGFIVNKKINKTNNSYDVSNASYFKPMMKAMDDSTKKSKSINTPLRIVHQVKPEEETEMDKLQLAMMSEHRDNDASKVKIKKDVVKSFSFAGEIVPTESAFIKQKLQREIGLFMTWRQGAQQMIAKAKYWMPIFDQILAKEGIPTDFKYLAVVESNLSNVVSPAGAAGFWQIMPSTARMAGLEINAEVDERYHPIKATYAAIKYLKYAQGKVNNWTNAAASYNMGIGGIQYALRRRGTNSYYDLTLNAESARYVFKTVAFKQIYENLEQYGLEGTKAIYYPPLREVEISNSINLTAFARKHGMTLKTLKQYNPWLKAYTLTVKNGKSYTLLLPH